MSNPAVFSITDSYTLPLRRGQFVTVNFPSDEQLTERERKIRTFYKKDSSIPTEDGREEADEKLILACKTEDSPTPNQDGCVEAVGKLLGARPQEPEMTPTGYKIALRVLWGAAGIDTVHELREPTRKEQGQYRDRATFMGEMKFGRQEVRSFLPAVVAFYDKLFVSVEGYDGNTAAAVPGCHKASVVAAMLAKIRAEEESDTLDPDPNVRPGKMDANPLAGN